MTPVPFKARSSLHSLRAWAIAGALAVAGTAHAGPVVHIDFQAGANTNTGYSSLSYGAGGANLVVTGWTTADTPPGVPRSGGYGRVTPAMGSAGGEDAGIYDGDSGLGVFQAGTDNKNLDGGDGSGEPDEAMMFLFDRNVELVAMNFNFWNSSDSIRFFVDGTYHSTYTGSSSDNAVLSMVGSMFVLLAEDDATSVRIQDLDFRVQDVPEPGTFLLAGLGLLGLRSAQRRRGSR